MTLRARIFIAISLGVLVIMAVSLFILYGKKDNNEPNNQVKSGNVVDQNNINQVNLGGVQPTAIPEGVKIKQASTAELQESGIIQLARTFVERYNTYSSDNSYQNIRDVESMVTSEYWSKISAPLSSQSSAGGFVGATTAFVSVTNSKFESSSASITIRAVKTLERDGALTSSYSDYTVSMVKRGSNWLINNQVEKKSS